MVLDVITISRRQPRLRSQKGAKIIFSIRSGFIRLCVYSRSRDSWKMRDSFPQPTFPPLHLAENSLLGGNCCEKRRGEEGRGEEAIVPSIPREEEIITNLMFNFYLLAISLAKTPPLLLLPLLHPWRNRGGKFPTRARLLTFLRRGETWKSINGEERSGALLRDTLVVDRKAKNARTFA